MQLGLLPQLLHDPVMEAVRRLGFLCKECAHLPEITQQRGARRALCKMRLELFTFAVGQRAVHAVRAELFEIFFIIHASRLLSHG